MISCPTVEKSVIRTHYNLSTPFYRLLWGPHIHHGYWEGHESPRVAQLQLTERLASLAEIAAGSDVIDIGCGMGGSSVHLSRALRCHVRGVTLSFVQKHWARMSALVKGVRSRTQFFCADAESIAFDAASADIVWSIECTEHLFDKPRFFQRAAQWLRPGGKVAICAWLAGENLQDDARKQLVYDVCEGFFCPSLGTFSDYAQWMTDAGLRMVHQQDWTANVLRTWELCRDRVERTHVRKIAKLLDRDQVMFIDRFTTLLNAYQTGAMAYGCFVAEKP